MKKEFPAFKKPTSDWIRRANELLQANFDPKEYGLLQEL